MELWVLSTLILLDDEIDPINFTNYKFEWLYAINKSIFFNKYTKKTFNSTYGINE